MSLTATTEPSVRRAFVFSKASATASDTVAVTLGQRGELTKGGAPSLLQTAVMVPEFGDVIRLTRPPWPVVRAICAVLRPIALRRGYRARLATS